MPVNPSSGIISLGQKIMLSIAGGIAGTVGGSPYTGLNARMSYLQKFGAYAATGHVGTGVQNYPGQGYVAGGYTSPEGTKAMTGFNYGQECFFPVGAQLLERTYAMAGNQNSSTKGYFTGGINSLNSTTSRLIDGITFLTLSSFTTGNLLTVQNSWARGLCSSTTGYSCGGVYTAGAIFAGAAQTIQTVNFSNDTPSSFVIQLDFNSREGAGTQSSTKGYYGGGYTSGSNSYTSDQIDGITFSTNTVTLISAVLRGSGGSGRAKLGAFASTTNGFFSPSIAQVGDKLNFSTEASSAIFGGLPTYTYGQYFPIQTFATFESDTKGYLNGGLNDETTRTLAFSFSSETGGIVSAANGGRSPKTGSSAGVSNKIASTKTDISFSSFYSTNGYAGYISGGFVTNTGETTSTEKLMMATLSTFMTEFFYDLKSAGAGMSSLSTNVGWMAGALSDTFPPNTFIRQTAYISDTTSIISGNLSQGRGRAAGMNSVTHGFVAGGAAWGGSSWAVFSSIEKHSFATQAYSSLSASLGRARYQCDAASCFDSAIICGGEDFSDVITTSKYVDALYFATDAKSSVATGIDGLIYYAGVNSFSGPADVPDVNDSRGHRAFFSGGMTRNTSTNVFFETNQVFYNQFPIAGGITLVPLAVEVIAFTGEQRYSTGISGAKQGFWAGGVPDTGANVSLRGINFSNLSKNTTLSGLYIPGKQRPVGHNSGAF